MGPVEIIVIVACVIFVVGVFGYTIYKKVTHKGNGCGCGCSDCSGCTSCHNPKDSSN